MSKFWASVDTDVPTYTRERMGLSVFVREHGVIYHSYSTYSRDVDALQGVYQLVARMSEARRAQ